MKRPLTEADFPIVYFYRPGAFTGMAVAFHLYLGEQRVMDLRNRSYTPVRLPPGSYRFSAGSWLGKPGSVMQLDLDPRQTYYVQIRYTEDPNNSNIF